MEQFKQDQYYNYQKENSMNQEEISKQIFEKSKKMLSEQIGNLVSVNFELAATKQILMDQINILENEVNQLRKQLGKNDNKEEESIE